MSIVNNGRISSNDQKVDKQKFDKGMDAISFDGAPWRKREEVGSKQSNRKAENG